VMVYSKSWAPLPGWVLLSTQLEMELYSFDRVMRFSIPFYPGQIFWPML
jgi:hypothetical protein